MLYTVSQLVGNQGCIEFAVFLRGSKSAWTAFATHQRLDLKQLLREREKVDHFVKFVFASLRHIFNRHWCVFCSFNRDALENDICSRLKMLQCMNLLFSFANQLCNAAWFNVLQRDMLLLNINQCFATNPFVIFISVFYQTFKNRKFSVFLPVGFYFHSTPWKTPWAYLCNDACCTRCFDLTLILP